MERELFDEEALREAANEIDRLCSQEGQQDRLEELYQTILEQTNRLLYGVSAGPPWIITVIWKMRKPGHGWKRWTAAMRR